MVSLRDDENRVGPSLKPCGRHVCTTSHQRAWERSLEQAVWTSSHLAGSPPCWSLDVFDTQKVTRHSPDPQVLPGLSETIARHIDSTHSVRSALAPRWLGRSVRPGRDRSIADR